MNYMNGIILQMPYWIVYLLLFEIRCLDIQHCFKIVPNTDWIRSENKSITGQYVLALPLTHPQWISNVYFTTENANFILFPGVPVYTNV